jgi:hypothetical protein
MSVVKIPPSDSIGHIGRTYRVIPSALYSRGLSGEPCSLLCALIVVFAAFSACFRRC